MVENIILVVFCLTFPGLIIFLEPRSRIIRWMSPIVLCFLVGIVIANLPFLHPDATIINNVTEISVAIAIPLLLFNTHVADWIKFAGKALFSYLLGCIGVVMSSILASKLLFSYFPDSWRVSGMLVGVYTGGTPNMSAIGIALETPEEIFVLLNSADVVMGALYFAFLITAAKKMLGLFLPRFSYDKTTTFEKVRDFASQKLTLRLIYNIVIFLILAIGVLGLAISISLYFTGKVEGPWVILGVSTGGIAISFSKRIQRMKGSYEAANYLLLVFSLAIGSLANIEQLLTKSPTIFFYVAFVMWLSIFIHFTLAAIFRIDRDTVIITSTAGIYGPAFIGPVANAIKNDKVIAPGIAMGLLGYAIGNYLGLGVAMLLK